MSSGHVSARPRTCRRDLTARSRAREDSRQARRSKIPTRNHIDTRGPIDVSARPSTAKSGTARRLDAIDLFAGCGGLSLGLRKAGFRVVGALEIDSLAAATYSRNHPDVMIWRTDIRKVTGARLLSDLGLRRGELALLAGCPPCQGFSAVRTLNGHKRIRDSRADLVLEFVRLVRSIRPAAIMFENVPGLTRNYRWRRTLRAFAQAGYECDWRIVDAADYGVPQRRRRLILVGSRLFDPKLAPTSGSWLTVRQAIGRLGKPPSRSDSCHGAERRSARIKARIRLVPKDGGSRLETPAEALACHRRLKGFFDIYGRMQWDGVAPTITGGCVNPSKGRFLHPSQNRAITVREAALLQSFPRRYRFDMSRGKYAAAEMVGNAFPPLLAWRHARRLFLSFPRAWTT